MADRYDEGWRDGWAARSEAAKEDSVSDPQSHAANRVLKGVNERLGADCEHYREALQDIVDASRDDGLAAMCNWMRGRAAAALGREGLND